jgi:hypothetical protein
MIFVLTLETYQSPFFGSPVKMIFVFAKWLNLSPFLTLILAGKGSPKQGTGCHGRSLTPFPA